MAKSTLLKSSIARKVVMSLSGLFLMLFLAQHLFINSTSVFSPDTFNEISHFMGYNPLVQYVIQPILIIGVIVHFIMGIVLELQNRAARPIGYASFNGAANSSWSSRNMIYTGAVVFAFLGLHFYDFWFPEIAYKYVDAGALEPTRYFAELQHKFVSPVRTGLYCISFVLLALHLWHGFSSSFQSIGARKVSVGTRAFGHAFAIVIPLGFIFIALFHHFNH